LTPPKEELIVLPQNKEALSYEVSPEVRVMLLVVKKLSTMRSI
jgi:hypothetical protein